MKGGDEMRISSNLSTGTLIYCPKCGCAVDLPKDLMDDENVRAIWQYCSLCGQEIMIIKEDK